MNWTRIALFGLIGILAANVAAYVMPDDGMTAGPMMREAAVIMVTGIVVFAWFGFIQRNRTVLHLALSAAVIWLLSFVWGAISHPIEPIVAVSSLFAIAIMAGMGLVVGLLARKLSKAG